MEKTRKKQSPKVEECIEAYRGTGNETDVMGSYTGVYHDAPLFGAPFYSSYDYSMVVDDTVPVQDADDL